MTIREELTKLCDEMAGASRCEIVNEAVRRGIKRTTAHSCLTGILKQAAARSEGEDAFARRLGDEARKAPKMQVEFIGGPLDGLRYSLPVWRYRDGSLYVFGSHLLMPTPTTEHSQKPTAAP